MELLRGNRFLFTVIKKPQKWMRNTPQPQEHICAIGQWRELIPAAASAPKLLLSSSLAFTASFGRDAQEILSLLPA